MRQTINKDFTFHGVLIPKGTVVKVKHIFKDKDYVGNFACICTIKDENIKGIKYNEDIIATIYFINF